MLKFSFRHPKEFIVREHNIGLTWRNAILTWTFYIWNLKSELWKSKGIRIFGIEIASRSIKWVDKF